jgi:hypothetical protein
MGEGPQNYEIHRWDEDKDPPTLPGIKPYSTDGIYAYEVLDKINRDGKFLLYVRPSPPLNSSNRSGYVCEAFRTNPTMFIEQVVETTCSLAICIGALITVRESVGQTS